MGKYQQELTRSMTLLGEDPRVFFLGQAVAYPGTAMSGTLVNVPKEKLIEYPVAEEMQMGASIGLSLGGFIPVTIYPRFNFLLLAMNQLILHLDKLAQMSQNGYQPKVIIRTSVGSERPLHPSYQHVGNFSQAFKLMLDNVEVIELNEPESIFPAYEKALNREDRKSTLLVEIGDYYAEK
jgi:pyruvate/2-oxoglutarate/acetoin dehydrogenase E1 component